jgi:hypothetical protein
LSAYVAVHAEDLLDHDDAALGLARGLRLIGVQREPVVGGELDRLAHVGLPSLAARV